MRDLQRATDVSRDTVEAEVDCGEILEHSIVRCHSRKETPDRH